MFTLRFTGVSLDGSTSMGSSSAAVLRTAATRENVKTPR